MHCLPTPPTPYCLLHVALLFINYSDRGALFCSSSDLITSIDHPSVFCNLSGTSKVLLFLVNAEPFLLFPVNMCTGAMLIYQNLQLSVLWFCHVSVMFLKLNFPFHARSLEVSGHNRYIHALCVAASLLVPIAPIAATFATNGFSMAQFPPFFCFPKNGAVIFYSLVLPVIILLVIGTAMLAAVIWNVHKVLMHSLTCCKLNFQPFPFLHTFVSPKQHLHGCFFRDNVCCIALYRFIIIFLQFFAQLQSV